MVSHTASKDPTAGDKPKDTLDGDISEKLKIGPGRHLTF